MSELQRIQPILCVMWIVILSLVSHHKTHALHCIPLIRICLHVLSSLLKPGSICPHDLRFLLLFLEFAIEHYYLWPITYTLTTAWNSFCDSLELWKYYSLSFEAKKYPDIPNL